ncbi:MAG: ornithine carbamoyltransferase [Candidatus Bathyarchaeota archaeon]|nr:ornithine carbamoyltransferase [Candidatus Bathyarchaeota archaeon]
MHLLNFKGLSGQQIMEIVDKGIEIKHCSEKYRDSLSGKTLAMIFQKTSTRTRVSFEVAMTQMGGHAIYMDWRATNFTIADIYDETQYLSRNVDCILARMLRHADLQVMAGASRVPVINGCDEKYHPTQIIADLITMKEKRGDLKGAKVVYVGVHNNVCNSLIEACTKVGIEITTVTPIFNEPSRDEDLLEEARKSGLWNRTLDFREAIKDADFIYTDTWIDMEFFSDPKYADEKDKRIKMMIPYQINKENVAGSSAWIMHDMPIHRGYEISPDMIEDPRSIIYEQSENRLYSAKAVLLKVLRLY